MGGTETFAFLIESHKITNFQRCLSCLCAALFVGGNKWDRPSGSFHHTWVITLAHTQSCLALKVTFTTEFMVSFADSKAAHDAGSVREVKN